MPQQIIPVSLKQVGHTLAHWQILPAFIGLMSLAKAALHTREAKQETPGLKAVRDRMPLGLGKSRGDQYLARLHAAWETVDWTQIERLGMALKDCWLDGRHVFICGNGGSAANAVHLANDLLYGVDKPVGRGMRVTALSANTAVMSCLGNDTSYAEIYSRQLVALARPGDLLIVFSGSGNSANILEALLEAKRIGMKSFAVLGYSGGKSLRLADHAIHFAVEDMQVSEDLQMMTGHLLSQWLYENRPGAGNGSVERL